MRKNKRNKRNIHWLTTLLILVVCLFTQKQEVGDSSVIQAKCTTQVEKNAKVEKTTKVKEITKVENTTEVEKSQESTESNESQIKKMKLKYVTEPYIIESTAYIATGNSCADGTMPIDGETLAGKREWIGRSCNLYYIAQDGSVGELIGTYKFHDTGFGDDPDGDGVGTIQNGQRIDIFMGSYDRAINWGVRNVYIEFLN